MEPMWSPVELKHSSNRARRSSIGVLRSSNRAQMKPGVAHLEPSGARAQWGSNWAQIERKWSPAALQFRFIFTINFNVVTCGRWMTCGEWMVCDQRMTCEEWMTCGGWVTCDEWVTVPEALVYTIRILLMFSPGPRASFCALY